MKVHWVPFNILSETRRKALKRVRGSHRRLAEKYSFSGFESVDSTTLVDRVTLEDRITAEELYHTS